MTPHRFEFQQLLSAGSLTFSRELQTTSVTDSQYPIVPDIDPVERSDSLGEVNQIPGRGGVRELPDPREVADP